MDGFSRILEKKLSELLCTRLYIHTIMFISVVKKILHRTMVSLMAKLNMYVFFSFFSIVLDDFLLTVDHVICQKFFVSFQAIAQNKCAMP